MIESKRKEQAPGEAKEKKKRGGNRTRATGLTSEVRGREEKPSGQGDVDEKCREEDDGEEKKKKQKKKKILHGTQWLMLMLTLLKLLCWFARGKEPS